MRSDLPEIGVAAAPLWVLEATTDCVILLDRQFRITYVNRAAAELNGFEPEDVVGKTNWEVWPSIIGTEVERYYRDAMSTGKPQRFEQHYVDPGHLDVWLEIHAFPSPDGLAIFFRDVSDDRRRAAREAEDRERLASAMRATDLGTWKCELPLDNRPLYWSPQVRRHFGISDDEEIGVEQFLQLLHPEDRQPTAEAMARAIEDHVPYDVVYRTLGRDGKTRWIRATGNAFYREDGTPYRFDGFTVELTERIETESALREAKIRSDATLASADIGTWVLEVATSRINGDANLARLFGIDPSTASTTTVGGYLAKVHPDDRSLVTTGLEKSIAEGSPYVTEYRVQTGQQERWLVARGTPELDGSGRVVRLPGVVVDITEQKVAQAARLQGEKRYRTLLDSIDEGFCIIEIVFDDAGVGVDYRYLEANPAFEKMSGVTVEYALAGLTMRQMYPGFEGSWAKLYGGVASTGVPASATDYSPTLNRWFEVNAVRVDEPGAGHVAVVFKDVTGRKVAEAERERLLAELAAEREKLQNLFEQAPAFLALLRGEEFTFEYVNRAYYGLVGHRELVGKTVAEALPEVVDQGFVSLLKSVLESGKPYAGQAIPVSLQRTSEAVVEQRYVDFVYQPVQGLSGEVDAILAHGIDVTDQVLAREAIAKSEERFRAVLETTPDPFTILIAVRDEAGEVVDFRWTFVNEATGGLTGETTEELVGALVSERRPGIRDSALYRHWLHTLETGEPFSHETFMDFPGGRTYLRLTGIRVDDGIATSFTDLTQRRLNEERLEAAVSDRTAQLQAAVKEAEGFNYSIAHDLRAPLRAVSSTAQILLEEIGPDLAQEHRDLLVRQAANANRLGRLIDELLRLSRLARAEVNRERLDMTAKVRSVFDDLEEQGKTNGCVLVAQEGMTADGDAGLVRTIFANLIGNACKFSPNGGTVRIAEKNGVFSVSDKGVGFDMAFAPKIFLPFERLVTEKEFEGTGIGLANVERIVRRHGGRVWVESEPGEGTTFFFTLGPGKGA